MSRPAATITPEPSTAEPGTAEPSTAERFVEATLELILDDAMRRLELLYGSDPGDEGAPGSMPDPTHIVEGRPGAES